MRKSIHVIVIALLMSGCASMNNAFSPEPKIHSSELMTEIISDPPGAKIEINNQYVGETPLNVHIDRNYIDVLGWSTVSIIANPLENGQQVQQKFINFNMPTPTKIYFNMNLVSVPNK